MENEKNNEVAVLVDDSEESAEPRVYELGYHLIPDLDESGIAKKEETLREKITSLGGVVVHARTPALIELAYPLQKKVAEKRSEYISAHFGWVAFSLPPRMVKELTLSVDRDPEIIRSLIVETDEQTVSAIVADPSLDSIGFHQLDEEIETVGTDTDVVSHHGSTPKEGVEEKTEDKV